MVHGLETLRVLNDEASRRKPKKVKPLPSLGNPAAVRRYLNRPWEEGPIETRTIGNLDEKSLSPRAVRDLVNSGALNDIPANNGHALEEDTKGAPSVNPSVRRRHANR